MKYLVYIYKAIPSKFNCSVKSTHGLSENAEEELAMILQELATNEQQKTGLKSLIRRIAITLSNYLHFQNIN